MDIVMILRSLSRHRVLVSGALVLAVLAGVGVTHKLPSFESRQYEVGVASERILVDTPSSQVVNVAPRGVGTVGVTANLLATLMIDGPVKSAIAAKAGLPPSKIVGTTTAATVAGGATSAPSRTDYTFSTQVVMDPSGNALPIVEVDVHAPTGAGAERLINAVVAGLKDFLNSTAAREQVPNADRVQVDTVAASPATTEARGPSTLIGFACFAGVFLLGCAAILGGQAFARGWRAAEAQDQAREDEPIEADEAVVSEDTALYPDRFVSAGRSERTPLYPDRLVSADPADGAAAPRPTTPYGPLGPLPQPHLRRSDRSRLQPPHTARGDKGQIEQQPEAQGRPAWTRSAQSDRETGPGSATAAAGD